MPIMKRRYIMVKLLYDENSVLDAQNKLNKYNANIIESLEKKNLEL